MKHLIVLVHGIQTFGNWQRRLHRLIHDKEPDVVVHEHNYGVRSFAVLLPGRRAKKVRQFREELLHVLSLEKWDRVDIVAHSFGTYIVGEALRGIARETTLADRPKVHTVLLAASVLPPEYPWRELTGDVVDRIVNDCSAYDKALLLTMFPLPGLGLGGRIGFEGFTGHSLFNRRFAFGHSGFFVEAQADTQSFMEEWWLPLLIGPATSVTPSEVGRTGKFATFIGWFERQAKLWRASILVGFIAAPILGISAYAAHQLAEKQRYMSESWALRSLQVNDQPGREAARLAIAAAEVSPSSISRQALGKALSTSSRLLRTLTLGPTLGGRLYALDPEGITLAVASFDLNRKLQVNLVQLRGNSNGFVRLPQQGCSSATELAKVAFSPTGRRLVVEGLEGSCVFDIELNRWVADLPRYDEVIFAGTDDRYYAITGEKSPRLGKLTYFGPGDAKDLAIPISLGIERDIASSANGDVFAVDWSGKVWRLGHDGESVQQIDMKPALENVKTVAVAPNSALLALGTSTGTIEVRSGDGLTTAWKASVAAPLKKIRFSEDGERIVAMLDDGSFCVWQAKDGKQLMMANGDGYPLDVRLLGASGDRVMSVNRGADLKVWSAASGQLLARVPMENDDNYASDDDGSMIVTTDRSGAVSAWDSTWQRKQYQFQLEEGIRKINVSTDHRFMTALGDHAQIREWDTNTGKVLLDVRAPTRESTAWNSMLTTSDNGQSVAFLNNTGLLTVWRAGSGIVFSVQMPRVVAEFVDKSHTGTVMRGFPIDMDRTLYGNCQKKVPLLAGGNDRAESSITRMCGLFDAVNQRVPGEISTDQFRGPIAVSDDGKLVALGFIDTVFVFDVTSRKLIATFSQGYESRSHFFQVEGANFGSAPLRWIAFTKHADYIITESRPDVFYGEGGNVIRTWSMHSPGNGLLATRVLPATAQNLGLSASRDFVLVKSPDKRTVEELDSSTLKRTILLPGDGVIDSVFTLSTGRPEISVITHLPDEKHPGATKTPFLYLKVFDAHDGAAIADTTIPLPVKSVAISRDGKNVAVDDGNGFFTLIDVSTGRAGAQFEAPGHPHQFWFAGSGTDLYYTSGGTDDYEAPLSGSDQINAVAWRPDELLHRLCGTLRAEDQTFDELSREAGKTISCVGL